MGHFGFSFTGAVYLLMLFIPNIIWAKNLPKDYDPGHENKYLLLLERAGEVLTSCCAVCFRDYDEHRPGTRIILLAVSFALMIMYELYWIRYFRSKRTLRDFYSSFLGVPLAGATLPVLAFLLLGVFGGVYWLIISAVILGIGHIGIHLQHYRELDGENKEQ